MQIELDADSVTALMSRLAPDARLPNSGFIYEEGQLTVPGPYEGAVAEVMATSGWHQPLATTTPTAAEKLAAFLTSNPDVAALVGV